MSKVSLLENRSKFILILCKIVKLYLKSSVVYLVYLHLPSIYTRAELFKTDCLQCTKKDNNLRSYLSIKSYKLIDKFRAAIGRSHPEKTSLQGK